MKLGINNVIPPRAASIWLHQQQHDNALLPNFTNVVQMLPDKTSNVCPILHTARVLLCVTLFVSSFQIGAMGQRFCVLKNTGAIVKTTSRDELQHVAQKWHPHWTDCVSRTTRQGVVRKIPRQQCLLYFLNKKSFSLLFDLSSFKQLSTVCFFSGICLGCKTLPF